MDNPTIPNLISLERDGEGDVRLSIDGIPLRWAISADAPIEVHMARTLPVCA